METHYYGPLGVTRAFAPILAANGGGAILNVLSVLSWLHVPAEGKTDPARVAAIALDGIEAGLPEILADDLTRTVKQGLAAPPPIPTLAA